MPLTPGTRLGPYEVRGALGAGGMGEVYRAHDVKLGRDVALKILPEGFATDPERVARFEREAKMLAALNHPHIAQIYGFEEGPEVASGFSRTRALVMELVDGEDLSQRMARGPIPLGEALPIATQIAEALGAAHEHGIIHRDLKPANIKVRADGTVKVLDFGLAKAVDPAGASSSGATITSPAVSMPGLVLGTAAYMAPEQTKGQPVDKRADLWAFGAVLYEMLSGRRAFRGDGASDTIARVLLEEPDWSALPAETPRPVGALLRRCLEKDRRRRLDSAAAARFAIEDALAAPAAETIAVGAPSSRRLAPFSRRLAPLAIAALAGGAVIALVALLASNMMRPAPPAPVPPSRYALVLPPLEAPNLNGSGRGLALSPDGRHLVYHAGGTRTGGSPLLVRGIGELDSRPLGVGSALGPFFSPDSQWIGFFASPPGIVDMLLMKVSITGGPAITLCAIKGSPLGASWGDDNTIVFATADPGTGLWQVPANGGEPTVLTKPDPAQRENDHVFPSVLPGGRGVLFTIAAAGPDPSQVAVLDLKTGQRKTLIRGGSDAEYVDPSITSTGSAPAGSGQAGYLIYAAARTLRAVRFDPVRLEVLGDPVPVIDPVMMTPAGAGNYAVSRPGTLVYVPDGPGAQTSLVWVDRKGREEPIKAPLRDYGTPRLSPDGTRVVVQITDQGNDDLWLWDLVPERLTRLTVDPARDVMPVWTRDSRRVIFASIRSGQPQSLFSAAADGTGTVEAVTTAAPCCGHMATSITPDGTGIVGFGSGRGTQQDLMLFSVTNPEKQELLLQTRFTESFPEVSPNGRYLAYQSNESGRVEVYVRPFPKVDTGRWQVSKDGGTRAAWARNGRELFYLDGSKALTAVPVETSGPTFTAGTPAKVFDAIYSSVFPARHYDVSPDGQRFLMMKDGAATPASLIVVDHWFEELKARVPQ